MYLLNDIIISVWKIKYVNNKEKSIRILQKIQILQKIIQK